jgi:hypothetical protein
VASVSITVKQVENVLTVPTGAGHTEENKTVVHQMSNGAQVCTPVQVGATYGAVTQIISGLKTGAYTRAITAAGATVTPAATTNQSGSAGQSAASRSAMSIGRAVTGTCRPHQTGKRCAHLGRYSVQGKD